ncbi:MAG: hypothetical protein HY787_20995 [Deltaproteobacteria bacterium]|nr:hypothetical protein [Deltaproteobacteria bacterium]
MEKIKEAAKQIEVLPRFLCTEHKQEFEIVGADKLLGVLHTIGSLRNDQYKDIYQLMLCPAVAGKGLYDTRHNLASVVMFLFPIVQQKQMDSRFWESKASVLGVICEAIAYHDRQMMPPLLKMHDVSRCLRIADELQEWERGPGKGSYFDQTEIVEDTEHWIEILFKLRGDKDFDPVRLVADKLLGLTPVVGSRAIKVTLELPRLEEGCRYSSLDSHER